MTKITKTVGNVIVGMSKKVTKSDVNSACPFITFQPKLTDSVKTLKKN